MLLLGLLKHLKVKVLVSISQNFEGLFCRVFGRFVQTDLIIKNFSIHAQKLQPKTFVSLVVHLSGSREIQNLKRKLVFFLLTAVIDNVLVGQVVFQLESIFVIWFDNCEHPFSNKRAPNKAKHQAKLLQLNSLGLFVAVLVESPLKIVQVFH